MQLGERIDDCKRTHFGNHVMIEYFVVEIAFDCP
jgi:hypothetical protein